MPIIKSYDISLIKRYSGPSNLITLPSKTPAIDASDSYLKEKEHTVKEQLMKSPQLTCYSNHVQNKISYKGCGRVWEKSVEENTGT
jgi:hypothetical protein